jgi:hypothetical protein
VKLSFIMPGKVSMIIKKNSAEENVEYHRIPGNKP